MSTKTSPLAPRSIPALPALAGVTMATASAGIKYAGRTDLLMMLFDEGTSVAGVFTQSRCPSAPVEVCRLHLPNGKARALVVNSGNANAFTGKSGRQATKMTVDATVAVTGVDPQSVFLSSTGVIGEPLDASGFEDHLHNMAQNMAADGWSEAARAIMTTDTFPKVATRTVELDGETVVINGIAKGAGMIAPDMATMLAYVATDAAIAAPVLQHILDSHVGSTFNAITVDSDTSTSDTLLAFATGQKDNSPIERVDDARYGVFSAALHDIMLDLSLQIVRDGEGVSKLIRVDVIGAATDQSAKRIALSIANSPLVKTAVAGQDANWGRVVMAVGKAGEPADRDRVTIWFGDICVARAGERVEDYSEEDCAAYMRNEEICIKVDLSLGPGSFTVWGCDLTADYVSINADYRS